MAGADAVDADFVAQAGAAAADVSWHRGSAEAPRYLAALVELSAHHTLARLAAQYLGDEVYGVQSPNTLEAKARDLAAFVRALRDPPQRAAPAQPGHLGAALS